MGKVVEYMPSCHSTNDIAREMLVRPDIAEGMVVITDHQVHGRGQRGNSWVSAIGQNLTLSVILKPSFLSVSKQFYLNMISSLAVMQTIEDLLGSSPLVQVKWPNDVMLNEKKVCGILIENIVRKSRLDYSIIGIGLNVNQKAFGFDRVTSISSALDREVELQKVMEILMSNLESLYLKLRSNKEQEIKEKYLENLLGYLKPRKYQSEYVFEGTIVDVLDSGLLKIKTPSGNNLFDFKAVSFLWN